MKKNYFLKKSTIFVVLMLIVQVATAQNASRLFWNKTGNGVQRTANRTWYPKHYQSFSLQTPAMKNFLSSAPMETPGALRSRSFIVDFPMPDGNFHSYSMVESPVMEKGLSDAYPSNKTYAGQGIDDPTATIRFDMTQFGFHAFVISANGIVYIDPVELGNTSDYIVYFKHDVPLELYRIECGLKTDEEKAELNSGHNRPYIPTTTMAIGNTLRTYRLALAADGEYTTYYGGNVAGALAGMVTTMNRVNGIYEREMDIHLNIVANDTLLIYTNSTTDPYTNNNGTTMLTQNVTTCNNVIGFANYDMGHVFSTGGGGIAGLGVICTTNKAKGVTGLPAPIGDPFDVDYVCHEMGHQFGAEHTFNATTGSCSGNVSTTSAYEPGSGTTIMAYAGICLASNNIANQGDTYFHTRSFDQIVSYSQSGAGNACAVVTNTGNSAPVLTMPNPLTYTIPFQTPFKLTASATDPDNDPVTYCWEEYDLGTNGTWTAPSGNAPIFRSFTPVTTGIRLFPKLAKILTPTSTDVGELLPTYARSLKFRCTARDNMAGGGGVIHSTSTITLTVVNTTVAFAITAPNTTGISWAAGTTQTVTWNVASTDVAPISTPTVNIYLSTNNGSTFPIVLATAVPNNGSYSFTVPNNQTANARIMVEGAGNVFFDINDKVFTITAPVGINENTISNSINIYPNPANDAFHFVVNTKTSGSCRVTLNDLAGRMVKEIKFDKSQSMADQVIPVSDVSKGLYLVRFELPEGITERKLIVE